ncbi:OmpH family outer membrane protein [Cyclobacterium xiamenense]|jgi:Skp family chaperone for outer membrane proteins|uniref:OmpH family outer membrane protein n=1 Tax=Cyclobacterium xiamenense TaxID=1297121 RepID=UPI0035D128C6
MKNLLFCLALVLIAGLHELHAQGAKIGIVKADEVIQLSKKGKKFMNERLLERDRVADEIKNLYEKYQQMEKDFSAKSPGMDERERMEASREMERLQVEIRSKSQKGETEFRETLDDGLAQITEELLPLIRQIGIEKGFDLIINDDGNSNVLYYRDAIDITNDVIARYDEL